MKKQIPRRNVLRLTAGLFALALLASPPAADSAKASSPAVEGHYTSSSLSAQERIAGNLLNSDRAAYGLPPLALDPALSRIARIKSQDMRDHQYFAHESPTYGDVRDMLDHFGVSYAAAGENIAHHATLEKSQAALISSPGHRANILSKSFTRVGIGVATDEHGHVYLTQIFAR